MTIVLCYETGEGHTARVAERIRERLEAAGCEVWLGRCREVAAERLGGAAGVIAGASVHMGKHHKRALRFAREHAGLLAERPAAFFSVSLTAKSDAEAKRRELAGYLEQFQQQSNWRPDQVATFAGAVPFTRYGLIKRKIMLSILRDEGMDPDPSRDYDFTDWAAVDAFADAFLERIG